MTATPQTSTGRLLPLLAPRGVVVIGASRDPAKLGAVMARSLRTFPGALAGVNPRDVDPAAGRHASVAEAAAAAGDPLDLAVLCVPASVSARALSEAADAGVRAALVCAGGFAEAGGVGVAYQEELLATARAAGVVLLGPNTSGFLAPGHGLTASFVPGAAAVPRGPVAVVAASGGVNHAIAFMLAQAGIGVSLAIGLGNAADVGAADVLMHLHGQLEGDQQTRAVALHLESVADGPALSAAVRLLTGRLPVVALVVGRNDVAEFARSHTGALATSWRVTRAALRQAGAVLVDDERALVDAVTALSAVRLPPCAAPGVGVVTAQAGPGLLHADGLRGAAIAVPPLAKPTRLRLAELLPPLTYQANPVDTGRPGPDFGAVLAAVADDPAVDLLSVYALAEPDAFDLPTALSAVSGRPAVVGSGGPVPQLAQLRDALRRSGVPFVTSPSALTTAVTALVHDAQAQARSLRRERAGSAAARRPDPAVTALLERPALDEDDAKTLLGRLGIASPRRQACSGRAQAHAALAQLPGPLAVKLLDATVTHKTEVGGVVLGVRDDAELADALDALEAAGARRFLVESMAAPGVDLIVGAMRDPVFGPVVLVGLGGVLAEALADVASAPAPLPVAEAAELLDGLTARALLDGFRGSAVVDRTAVGAIVTALGDLLVQYPQVEAIEINPLRASASGLLALDAVVTLMPHTNAVAAQGGALA